MSEYSIIGFADEYYTLWNHNRNGYFFVKNISKDINVVKELYPDLEIDLGLRGNQYNRNYNVVESKREHNQFPFGKYQDKFVEDILKLDINYCLWVIETEIFNKTINDIILNSEEYNNYINELNSNITYLKINDTFTYTFDKNIPYESNNIYCKLNKLNVYINNIETKNVNGLYPYSQGLVNGKFVSFKNKTFTFQVTNIIEQKLNIKFKTGNQIIEVKIIK